ncbi:SPFH domain-containing protein [Diplonema papillatum]|nr:SPFH domain-containing protein [Diplonema papillatum]
MSSSVRPDEEIGEATVEEVPWYMNLLRYTLGLLLLPITLISMWNVVQPNETLIVVCFGKLAQVIPTPGCYPIVNWGCTFLKLSTKQTTIDTGKSTISDLNGNPVIVSAVVNYHIVNAVKAVFNVENVHDYVHVNAGTVLKSVVSKYPYECKDHNQPSLKTCSDEVRAELARELRARTKMAGVEVASFDLSDLYYAPEIASAMLVRQQAQAMLDARQLIVDGAVGIVGSALHGLSQNGVTVTEGEACRIASNLLCVLCSEGHTQNVIPMQG